jgi:hypothetical protein
MTKINTLDLHKSRGGLDFKKPPKPIDFGLSLQKVTEGQLREYAKAKAVTEESIVQTDKGFILTFTLSWASGVFTLYTVRGGRPRTFVSLDRMLRFLDSENLLLKEVTLKLMPTLSQVSTKQ